MHWWYGLDSFCSEAQIKCGAKADFVLSPSTNPTRLRKAFETLFIPFRRVISVWVCWCDWKIGEIDFAVLVWISILGHERVLTCATTVDECNSLHHSSWCKQTCVCLSHIVRQMEFALGILLGKRKCVAESTFGELLFRRGNQKEARSNVGHRISSSVKMMACCDFWTRRNFVKSIFLSRMLIQHVRFTPLRVRHDLCQLLCFGNEFLEGKRSSTSNDHNSSGISVCYNFQIYSYIIPLSDPSKHQLF